MKNLQKIFSTVGKSVQSKLAENEWNFSKPKVPDAQLVACCYWEYARESKFIRAATEIMKKVRDGESLNTAQQKIIDRLFEICSAPDQSPDYFFRSPPFPKPWQQLNDDEKSPLRISTNETLHVIDSRLPWGRFQNSDSSSGRVISRAGVEYALIKLNWGKCTNAEISDALGKWVKNNRPANIVEPTQRGHKPKDWRASLERLGIMRLMHWHNFDELNVIAQNALDSKSSDREKFASKAVCMREYRKALNDFHDLFPHLSDEQPMSWEPLSGAW